MRLVKFTNSFSFRGDKALLPPAMMHIYKLWVYLVLINSRVLTESGQSILLEIVHRHWFFDPQQAPSHLPVVLDPRIQNPLPVRTRGRPRGGATGTRRHLSQFEIVTRSRQLRSGGANSRAQ